MSKKTQHGDPVPEGPMKEEDVRAAPGYMPTSEAIRPKPVTVGKIGFIKRCGLCGLELSPDAVVCPKCAPNAQPHHGGGSNMRSDEHVRQPARRG